MTREIGIEYYLQDNFSNLGSSLTTHSNGVGFQEPMRGGLHV